MNLGSVYLTMIGGREVFSFFSRCLESTIILKIPACFRYNSLAAGFGCLTDFITFSAAFLLDVLYEPQPKESRFFWHFIEDKTFRHFTDISGDGTITSVPACHCCSLTTCWRILLTGHVDRKTSTSLTDIPIFSLVKAAAYGFLVIWLPDLDGLLSEPGRHRHRDQGSVRISCRRVN